MKWTRIWLFVLLVGVMGASNSVEAASSLSNSLSGFSGDTTQAGTQADLSAAGLNVFSTDPNPAVAFDTTGATFGSAAPGDDGRNYLRTNESDYAFVSFVAEITVERTSTADPDGQQVFFGLGAGDTALFGVPDWSTVFSSTFITLDPGTFVYFRTSDDVNEFVGTDPIVAGVGSHRLRMTFDSLARTLVYEIDEDYAGGPFSADASSGVVDLNTATCPAGNCGGGATADFFGPDGWPGEPSRIYFGGDDGTIFRDLDITVIPEPAGASLCLAGLLAGVCRRRRN